MNRITVVLTATLLWPCAAASAQGPKKLDPEVAMAWQSAGAEVGWYGRTKNGDWGYTTGKPDDDKALPAIDLMWKGPLGGNSGGNGLNPGCPIGYPLNPLYPRGVGNNPLYRTGPDGMPLSIILQPVNLSTLPAPAVPFALFLDSIMAMDSLTDAGMRDIARFKTLQYLSISGTRVTDVGMKELLKLNDNLQHLNLAGLHISDAGLQSLVKLQGLRYLMLGGQTKVTDTGMKDLARLKNLQTLGLIGTGISDGGLKELARLENLEVLWLGSALVTDAGLKELSGMKSLKYLALPTTKVTDAGVAQLQKALPKLTIVR
jgi:hypothetical protein